MDIKNMSNEELKNLSKLISEEQARRENYRFEELVNNLSSAIDTLKKEFPFVQWYVEVDDSYGTTETIDIFDYISNHNINDITH